MTALREQLQSARTAYLSARYPGDLAAEVLPPGRRGGGRRMFLVVGSIGAGALAAAAALALCAGRPSFIPATPRSVDLPALVKGMLPAPPKMQWTTPTLPSVPGLPEQLG